LEEDPSAQLVRKRKRDSAASSWAEEGKRKIEFKE
jgi:hypothetical protein